MGIAFKESVLRETWQNVGKIIQKEFIFNRHGGLDGEGNTTIMGLYYICF